MAFIFGFFQAVFQAVSLSGSSRRCRFFLSSAIVSAGFFFPGCRPAEYPDHKAQLEPVLAKARLMRENGQAKQSMRLVDSTYGQIIHKGTGDLVNLHGFKAHHYWHHNVDFPKALEQLDSSIYTILVSSRKDSFARQLSMAYMLKGDMFMEKKLFKEAFQNYFKGRAVSVSNANAIEPEEYSHRLGLASFRQENYPAAISYFKQGITELNRIKDPFFVYSRHQELLDNIALCYQKGGVTDSAYHYFQKAISFIVADSSRFHEKSLYIKKALGVIYGNMADAYKQEGNLPKAEALMKLGIESNLPTKKGDMYACYTMLQLAELYLDQGRFNNLKPLLVSLRDQLDTMPDEKGELGWVKLQWRYHTALHDSLGAYRYYLGYVPLKDSLTAKSKNLAGDDLGRELEKLDQRREMDRLVQEAELKTAYLAIALLFVVMAVIILYLGRRNRLQAKQNIKELTALNRLVSEQNLNLHNTLASLEKSQAENAHIMKVVAHDLRSPISSMLMATDVLLNYPEIQQVNKTGILLNLIRKSGNGSLELISDLLNSQTGNLNIEKEPVDVGGLLHYCTDLLTYKAAEKQQQISLEVSSVTVRLNREKIWRVFNNIITNALKFSPPATTVTIHTFETNTHVLVSIKDQGIGIPENLHHKIFDMFSQARRQGTEGEETYGLGLSISKQIVEAHGGRIWFKSEAGGGTVFYVELPKQ